MLSAVNKPFMLSVFMLSVFMLSVFMLSVFMLSVFTLSVFMLVYLCRVSHLSPYDVCSYAECRGAKDSNNLV